MIQRKEVVLSVLGELQDATESSGLDALTRVVLEVYQVLTPFTLPSSPCHEFPDWADIDGVAHSLYPADAPGGLLPLVCKGEGNLLFDAASMLLVGTTSLSMELQVRTVVEMLLWKRYYLGGMIDSKVMLQAARFSLCAEESEDMLNLPLSVLEAIFDADVKASCFPGSYANMWHLYALSSVLQCNIYSVYPMYNLKIRPYFNRLIRPRSYPKDVNPITMHIMWSGELEGGSSRFRPRVFLALVQASDLQMGSPNDEQRVPPLKTLELLNQDSHLSYSSLKDKYNITKSTFYRWRRQTQEHRKKSAARYEAKHFLQACFLEGKLIPLHQFKDFFPEISRSTYYAWKHELISSSGSFSTFSAGEVSPGDSTEQETWSSPESKPGQEEDHVVEPDPEHQDSVASLFGLNNDKMDGERAQNLALMQEAKKVLQNCIAMNTSFPFRIFKRSFPGISRSTYYNWRREAMLFNRGYKVGSSENSLDADKSSPTGGLSPIGGTDSHGHAATVFSRIKICRNNHKGFRMVFLRRKKLREAAKVKVWRSKWPLSRFRVKYPSLSLCFYWLWRNGPSRTRKEGIATPSLEIDRSEMIIMENNNNNAVKENGMMMAESERNTRGPIQDVFSFEGDPTEDQRGPVTMTSVTSPFDASLPLPRYPLPLPNPTKMSAAATTTPTDDQMFVMDLVALANFKAKAKVFLQQRFEEKSFPTFKEFRSHFPLTPRSTYYMWKRALHHGVPLVHG